MMQIYPLPPLMMQESCMVSERIAFKFLFPLLHMSIDMQLLNAISDQNEQFSSASHPRDNPE